VMLNVSCKLLRLAKPMKQAGKHKGFIDDAKTFIGLVKVNPKLAVSLGVGAITSQINVEALPLLPDTAKKSIENALQKLPEKAGDAAEKIGAFTEQATHQADEFIHTAVPKKVLDKIEEIPEKAKQIPAKVKEFLDSDAGHAIKDKVTGAVDSAKHVIEENAGPVEAKLKSAVGFVVHEAPHAKEAVAQFVHDKLPGQLEKVAEVVEHNLPVKAIAGKLNALKNKVTHPGRKETSDVAANPKTGGFYRSEVIPSQQARDIIAGATNFQSSEDKSKAVEHLRTARLVKHYEKVVAGVIHLYIFKVEEQYECYEVFTGFSGESEVLHFIQGAEFGKVTYRCLRLPQGETIGNELAGLF
jgi:hypothetical protein